MGFGGRFGFTQTIKQENCFKKLESPSVGYNKSIWGFGSLGIELPTEGDNESKGSMCCFGRYLKE